MQLKVKPIQERKVWWEEYLVRVDAPHPTEDKVWSRWGRACNNTEGQPRHLRYYKLMPTAQYERRSR